MNHPFLRAMTAGEMILTGLRTYRDHFQLLVLVALFPHLALLAVELLMMLGGPAGGGSLLIVLGATVVVNAVALAALTVATGRAALGQEPTLLEIYAQTAASRPGAVVVAYLITAVLVSAGMMALILPGIVLGALFAPTVPAIVLERRGPADGIVRAVKLMRPHWLKGTVVFSYFILVAGFLPLFLLILQDSMGTGPLTPLLSAIIGSVTLPLGFSPQVVLYFSLRADEEGAAHQLAAALEPPVPD